LLKKGGFVENSRKYRRIITLGARDEGLGVRDWKENAKIKVENAKPQLKM